MTESKLKLIKSQKKQTHQTSRADKKENPLVKKQATLETKKNLKLIRHPAQIEKALSEPDLVKTSPTAPDQTPKLTAAEEAEAARFKAAAATRAAQQAMINRIMTDLLELDRISPVA